MYLQGPSLPSVSEYATYEDAWLLDCGSSDLVILTLIIDTESIVANSTIITHTGDGY
jgi:hypothetical protein